VRACVRQGGGGREIDEVRGGEVGERTNARCARRRAGAAAAPSSHASHRARSATHIRAVAVTEPVKPKITVMPGRKIAASVVTTTRNNASRMRISVSVHVALGAAALRGVWPFWGDRPDAAEPRAPSPRPMDSYRDPNSDLSSATPSPSYSTLAPSRRNASSAMLASAEVFGLFAPGIGLARRESISCGCNAWCSSLRRAASSPSPPVSPSSAPRAPPKHIWKTLTISSNSRCIDLRPEYDITG
jgi:hypothetical protein